MPDQARGHKLTLLNVGRVGHLATVNDKGIPYLVPVVFAWDGRKIYIAIDSKKKSVPAERLKRVRNILGNPNVALIVDHYSEQWEELEYILVHGLARLLKQGKAHQKALEMLKAKYTQYQYMPLEKALVICINPQTLVYWSAVDRNS